MNISDILIHLFEFLLLGLITRMYFKKIDIWHFFLFLLYITFHESIQFLIPLRHASISDWVCDLFGFILGYLIGAIFVKKSSY